MAQDSNHPHGDGMLAGHSALHEELVHHLPFSISAVAIGLTIAGIVCFLAPVREDATTAWKAETDAPGKDLLQAGDPKAPNGDRSDHGVNLGHGSSSEHDRRFLTLFHLFHPMHMMFSAAATTAMFWRYERRVLKAVIIGLIGAVGVCGLSDIVMPHLSLRLLGKTLPWHICVIENPSMVFSFAIVGVVTGLAASGGVRHSTFFSHSLHVLSSTMASILYLIRPFGQLAWIDSIGLVFLFVILAVMIPCCLSDIVFPLCLARGAFGRYRDEHVGCGGT